MPDAFIPQYLTDAIRQFRNLKALAEGAMAQIDRKALYTVLDEEANSIAVLLKHMAGSMRARWADFPAAAEDMGARNRDSEFMITAEASKEVLLERWEAGWQYLFDALVEDQVPIHVKDQHLLVRSNDAPVYPPDVVQGE